jgi:hypothetical protein
MLCFEKTDRRVGSVIGRNDAAAITEPVPTFLCSSGPRTPSGGTSDRVGGRMRNNAKFGVTRIGNRNITTNTERFLRGYSATLSVD